MTTVIAIDVGGTGMKCGLVDENGTLLHIERHPTGAARGPEAVVTTILEVATGLAARAQGAAEAVGIVVPGVVDERHGVATWSANVGFRDVPLRDLLTKHLGLPAALGHDVRAGGAAEARLGAGRGYEHMIFLAIGTGIAGAHVVGGVSFAGAHGAAGEVGHLIVRPGGPRCGVVLDGRGGALPERWGALAVEGRPRPPGRTRSCPSKRGAPPRWPRQSGLFLRLGDTSPVTRTFTARGPRSPTSTSNSTRCPGSKNSQPFNAV